MTVKSEHYSVRECAQDLIALLNRHGNDLAAAEMEAIPYVQRLLKRPDLLEIGVKRDGNHTGDSLWLYYDHQLSIMTGKIPLGTSVPVHNHGTWELVAVYTGAVKYTQYERVDDGSQTFYADLRSIDDRIMRPGDVSICPPPPNDIHGFTALTEDTVIVAAVGGNFAPIRHYFNPHEKYYIERHQQVWRLGDRPKGSH